MKPRNISKLVGMAIGAAIVYLATKELSPEKKPSVKKIEDLEGEEANIIESLRAEPDHGAIVSGDGKRLYMIVNEGTSLESVIRFTAPDTFHGMTEEEINVWILDAWGKNWNKRMGRES